MIRTRTQGMRKGRVRMREATAPLVALLALFAAISIAQPAWATSLYSSSDGQGLFTQIYADNKARNVGDLLTILVTEVSYAQNKSNVQTQQGIGVDAKPGIGPFDFLPAARLDIGDSSRGQTETYRSGRLLGTITAQVVEVLPNGDLLIRGTREVSVNSEKEQMIVTGIVRQRDISPNNTISSSLVANAEIAFSGAVYTGEKGGVFKSLWDGLVTIWNWIF